MSDNSHVYKRIKETRQSLGISQTELAKRVGYADKTMISHIENGKIDLSATKLMEIANALNVSPGYLMGWEDDGIPTVTTEYDETTGQNNILVKAEKWSEFLDLLENTDEGIVKYIENFLRANQRKS